MLRFAPSPTGDMHIGDLRVAVFNYIVSKQKNENLIVRIEDMNKEQNIDAKDKEILDILGLFGIEYTQVVYQSENIRFHTAMALQLMHEKKAFSCFCSDEWLDKKQKEAKKAKKLYKYDDACKNLPHELVIDNTNPFTIRIKKAEETLVIKDHIQGEIVFESKDMDSFVIMNQDKSPMYDFACAVDDMLSDISIIIRSEKHINNTPKQALVRTSLSYSKKIEYAHIPTILDEDNFSIKWLLEEGFLPEAILNYLISIGNKPPKEIFTLEEATEWFKLEKVSKKSIKFDIEILKHINNEYLNNLDAKELSRYVGFADDEIGKLARVYLNEVNTTKELKLKISNIFVSKNIPNKLLSSSKIIIEIIKNAPYFEEYDEFKKYIIKKSELEDEIFSKTFRYVLTGAENGPDIAMIYKYLKNYIGEIIK